MKQKKDIMRLYESQMLFTFLCYTEKNFSLNNFSLSMRIDDVFMTLHNSDDENVEEKEEVAFVGKKVFFFPF